MTEKSYVWDGVTVGDGADAPYESSEWATVQRSLIGGERADYGVIDGSGDGTNLPLTVVASSPVSKVIHLNPGAALVNGRLYINNADLTFTVQDNSSGSPRVDLLVIRRDAVAQTARAVLRQGTPAGSPVPPTLTQNSTTYEIPIATIQVANGFASLAQTAIANVANVIGGNSCLYIEDVINQSGGRLETGDPVIWHATLVGRVNTTNRINDPKLAGIWVGSTAAGAKGRVQVRGFGWVNIKAGTGLAGQPAGVTFLDGLATGDTVNRAITGRSFYADKTHGIGRALETVASLAAGGQRVFCYIDVAEHPAFEQVYTSNANPTYTSGAMRKVAVNKRGTGDTLIDNTDPPDISFDSANNQWTIALNAPYKVEWDSGVTEGGVSVSQWNNTTTAFVKNGSLISSPAGSLGYSMSHGLFIREVSTDGVWQLNHRVTSNSSTPAAPFGLSDYQIPVYVKIRRSWY